MLSLIYLNNYSNKLSNGVRKSHQARQTRDTRRARIRVRLHPHQPRLPTRQPRHLDPDDPRQGIPGHHTIRTDLHHRTNPVPDLVAARIASGGKRGLRSLHQAGGEVP